MLYIESMMEYPTWSGCAATSRPQDGIAVWARQSLALVVEAIAVLVDDDGERGAQSESGDDGRRRISAARPVKWPPRDTGWGSADALARPWSSMSLCLARRPGYRGVPRIRKIRRRRPPGAGEPVRDRPGNPPEASTTARPSSRRLSPSMVTSQWLKRSPSTCT